MIIDGKKTAAELREKLKKQVAELRSTYNAIPGLTVILVGEDPASKIYVKNKEKFAKEVGMNSEVIRYPADLEEEELLNKIMELNKNKKVSGILVQLPLPKHDCQRSKNCKFDGLHGRPGARRTAFFKIGRASCRERV